MDSQILTLLMSCPAKYDLRHNQLLVPSAGKSNALECGSLAHCVLEFYNKALIAGFDRTKAIEQGFEAAKEYLLPYAPTNNYIKDVDHVGVQNTPEESGKYEINGRQKELIGWKYVFATMQEYFDHYRNDSWTPIAAEDVRGKILYEDSDIRILWKAKFDQIDDSPIGIISTDHKTMNQRRETLDLNNQFMGQCFLLNSRQVRVNKIGWQKSLKANEKFERVLIPYSIDRLAEWANEIVPHYARMLVAFNEANYFPMNFTACETKYGFCEYKSIHQADRGMRADVSRIEFIQGKAWDITND